MFQVLPGSRIGGLNRSGDFLTQLLKGHVDFPHALPFTQVGRFSPVLGHRLGLGPGLGASLLGLLLAVLDLDALLDGALPELVLVLVHVVAVG